jgi:hypothetical protein
MSKSVINSDYLTKQDLPPYETSERQLKKQRKVIELFRIVFKLNDFFILKF